MSRSTCNPSDVVQATRLPFDPGSSIAEMRYPDDRRPTWRSFGARVSRTGPKMGRQKLWLNTGVHFFLRAGGVFLPQAGPRFDLVLLKLGITSLSCRSVTSWNDEGDPLGRPRLARNAARNLACTPPSEGKDMVELEPGTDVLPGRHRRGWRRCGRVHLGVDHGQHLCSVPVRRWRIEHLNGLRKVFAQKIHIASSRTAF